MVLADRRVASTRLKSQGSSLGTFAQSTFVRPPPTDDDLLVRQLTPARPRLTD